MPYLNFFMSLRTLATASSFHKNNTNKNKNALTVICNLGRNHGNEQEVKEVIEYKFLFFCPKKDLVGLETAL